jgi:hypothetical protein
MSEDIDEYLLRSQEDDGTDEEKEEVMPVRGYSDDCKSYW